MIVTICSGGQIGDWALPYLKQADYLIGVDYGAHFAIMHGFFPNLSIGDFDSVTEEQVKEIEQQSQTFKGFDAIDKDYTDTHLAVIHAFELKPKLINLVGALGTRFDHSLGNIHLLELALEQKIPMRIIDEHNSIQMLDASNSLSIDRLDYHYVSLLPQSKQVTDIKLQGFKYPLKDVPLHLTRGISMGISNELVQEQGTISIGSGKLLVIQAKD